ncbi:MAG: DUF3047 domain-containing protein [Nitrospirae bacterium]|nr:MAG: DUF3047 domain-containing protein [Nitrospirota bacterium]
MNRAAILLIVLFFLLITPLNSGLTKAGIIKLTFSGLPDSKGVPDGWKLKERKGRAEFWIQHEDNDTVIYMKSNRASFSLERPLEIDPHEYPFLSWRWKVMSLPKGGDMRNKDKNDQAAQVLVIFEGKRTISYVWDTTAPEGTVTDESIGWPINIKIKVIAVKSGYKDLNKWVEVKRNLLEDYRRLYRDEPGKIKGIRIQINTQHTGTSAECAFGSILFMAPSLMPEP